MIVCMCRVLSDRAIRAAIAGGAATIEDVGAACRAGTDCGACLPLLERMIEEAGAPVGGDAWASPCLAAPGRDRHEGARQDH